MEKSEDIWLFACVGNIFQNFNVSSPDPVKIVDSSIK